jgi:protein-L-isoaspartate(D-aspartate) O-methyltransferase
MKRFDFTRLREHMVHNQIVARGVHSHRVLGAMHAVLREAFLPESLWQVAYDGAPLPVAEGQTIS